MDTVSPDLPQFIRLLVALAFVLILMGGLSYVLKKMGFSNAVSIKSGDKRRLSVVESLPLDARRRAVILKCDDAEHLLILNANGETLIASDIPSVDDSKDSQSKP